MKFILLSNTTLFGILAVVTGEWLFAIPQFVSLACFVVVAVVEVRGLMNDTEPEEHAP